MHATETHKKIPKVLISRKLKWCTIYIHYISSNSSKYFGRMYNTSMWRTSWEYAVDTPEICRRVWRNILKINCVSWSTKPETQKYCLSLKVKQTKLFICLTTLLAHQVFGQCKLASKLDVLFYSPSNLLPSCGVQSVQRNAGISTNIY